MAVALPPFNKVGPDYVTHQTKRGVLPRVGATTLQCCFHKLLWEQSKLAIVENRHNNDPSRAKNLLNKAALRIVKTHGARSDDTDHRSQPHQCFLDSRLPLRRWRNGCTKDKKHPSGISEIKRAAITGLITGGSKPADPSSGRLTYCRRMLRSRRDGPAKIGTY
ncbi:unnamed protein product, partial [Iphiclides podalirius]